MKTKTEIITVEYAMHVLEKLNPRNRPISEATVQSYATDMRNGRWTLTHQGLAFDSDGNLIDGQHRLWAVVMSGCELEIMVTRGIPTSEVKAGVELHPVDNIDRLRARSTGNVLQMSHGIKNGAQVAAACRSITYMVDPTHGAHRLSSATTLLVYDLYKEHIERILDTMAPGKRLGYIVGPLSMYHGFAPEKAIDFRNQISTLEGMGPHARLFLKWHDQNRSRGAAERSQRAIAIVLKAFHHDDNLTRIMDSPEGRIFLVNINPAVNKRIRDAIKPVKAKSGLKM